MRVGIDATSWANRRGYGRYTRGLLKALLRRNQEHEYVFFWDSLAQPDEELEAEHVVVDTGRAQTEAAAHDGSRSLRDLLTMGRAVAKVELDALLFPTVYTFFPVRTRAKVIVGIHDVIAETYPELVFPRRSNRLFWHLKVAVARRQADYILTVSDYSKQEIARHFGTAPDTIWVVEDAADAIFEESAVDPEHPLLKRLGLEGGARFLVYLGGVNPHKNVPGLIRALADLGEHEGELKLAIVGEVERESFTPGARPVSELIDELGLEKRVFFTGYIDDDELVMLLNAAAALVLPSFAEGFGLPAVEAAACGTPVVATRNSPLPQLLEGGGAFVDPADQRSISAGVKQVLGNEEERRQMGEVAKQRARQLSWDRSAQKFERLLAHLSQEGSR